ncbi:hypothetical protein [Candidatus Similichlamydia epinepheli]|uniref:hypothetical protein n=1 Tax=Candidatus Similichlamydia epinepheli TaxID=1903953 RepID=UPI001863F66C|nr:hypothetical protein [Candidatus Similichlamydia epinepheli]
MSRIGTFLFRDVSPTFCFFLPSVVSATALPIPVSVISCFLSGFGLSLNCFEAGLVYLKNKNLREVFGKSRIVSHCVLWGSACLMIFLSFELALKGLWLLGSLAFLSSCIYLMEYYFCCTLQVDLRTLVRSISSKVRLLYLFLSILLIAVTHGKSTLA